MSLFPIKPSMPLFEAAVVVAEQHSNLRQWIGCDALPNVPAPNGPLFHGNPHLYTCAMLTLMEHARRQREAGGWRLRWLRFRSWLWRVTHR